MSHAAPNPVNNQDGQKPDRAKFLFRGSIFVASTWLFVTIIAGVIALDLSSDRRPAEIRLFGKCRRVEFRSQSPTELRFLRPDTSFRKIESTGLNSLWTEPLKVSSEKSDLAAEVTRLEAVPRAGDSLQLAAQIPTVLNVTIAPDTLAKIQSSGSGEELRMEVTAIQEGGFQAHGMKVLPSNIDFDFQSNQPSPSLPRLAAFELNPSISQVARNPVSVEFSSALKDLGTVQMWWQDKAVRFQKGKTEFTVDSISLADIRISELLVDGQAVTDYSEGHLKISLRAVDPSKGVCAKVVALDDDGLSILVEGTVDELLSMTDDGQRKILLSEFERISKAPVDSSNIFAKVFVIGWLQNLGVAVAVAAVLGAFTAIKAYLVPKKEHS